MNATEEVLAQLSPALRKSVNLGSDVEYFRQPLPSATLTRALNGGLPYGRQSLIWGAKSAAKSSLCLQIVAMAQAEGKTAAWIDAEQSFDYNWAESLGVRTNELIYSEAKTTNDMANAGTSLMDAGIDVLVVDSISALLPAIYFEKDSTELKNLENTKQIGADSKDMGGAVKMLNFANKKTLLILISQQRNQISAMYTQLQPTGGQATKFYSSVIIKLFSSESQKQAIEKKLQVGDKLINEIIGRKILWDIQFSKTSPPFQKGEYDFYFRGDNIGIDTVGDLADLAVTLGIIEKGGSWYTAGEERYQGRDRLIDGLRADSELFAKIQAGVINV